MVSENVVHVDGRATTTRDRWSRGDGFREWHPPTEGLDRAFVLAGGGATGIAWEAGIIIGLRDGGIDVRDADTMIGTSAGSMVAAHLRVGTDEGNAFARIQEGAPLASYGRLGAADAARYLRARCTSTSSAGEPSSARPPSPRRRPPRRTGCGPSASGLVGKPWPERRLFVTAVDAQTGTSVVFDNTSGVPLERAVAASCAVPGVFPAVEVGGRRYVDGGLRSIANADLAAGHRRVLVLSPYPIASHLRDLPPVQLLTLKPTGQDPPRGPRRQGPVGDGRQPARHEPRRRHLRDGPRPRRPDRRPGRRDVGRLSRPDAAGRPERLRQRGARCITAAARAS